MIGVVPAPALGSEYVQPIVPLSIVSSSVYRRSRPYFDWKQPVGTIGRRNSITDGQVPHQRFEGLVCREFVLSIQRHLIGIGCVDHTSRGDNVILVTQ